MNHVALTASTAGQLVQPFLKAMAWLLALFFSFTHNYILAITLLTVLVMVVTAPLTVKSTRSMMVMQRLAPEIKKLQAKYKKDEREKLNEELMNLYRENGASPVGGCLPLLAQMPFFIALYTVIKGLTNVVHGRAAPRYLGAGSGMYKAIIAAHGKLVSFGIDLAVKPFAHHGSFGKALPYWAIFFGAMALQYIQMARLNRRNAAQGMQLTDQQRMARNMQYFAPLIFGVIYLEFPIGITTYFLVSSLCRITIQELMFHAGITKVKPVEERISGAGTNGAKARRRTFLDRMAEAQERAREQLRQQEERRAGIESATGSTPTPSPKAPSKTPPGRSALPPKATGTSANGASNNSQAEPSQNGKEHPRSKSKRPRRTR